MIYHKNVLKNNLKYIKVKERSGKEGKAAPWD